MVFWEHQFIIWFFIETINCSYDNCSDTVMVIIYTYLLCDNE